jgi:hypothetical protein
MNKSKEKIIKLGFFTINPIYLKNTMTGNERDVLDIIIHFEDQKKDY